MAFIGSLCGHLLFNERTMPIAKALISVKAFRQFREAPSNRQGGGVAPERTSANS